MNILVPIKSVIDVELTIRVQDGRLVEDGLQHVLSKWDENAVEAALQLKEAGEGEVTVVSVGPERCAEILRKALAMGADQAIHVQDEAAAGSDAFGYGRILAAVAQRGDYQLVITGKQAQDTDLGATGAVMATLLDWPVVANVAHIEGGGDALTVHRQGTAGHEVLRVQLPAVLTASDSLNEPRLASLRGIMQAKKKPFETLSLADLGVDAGQVGAGAARTEIAAYKSPQGRGAGQKFEGDPEEIVPQVVEKLANEAKVFS